MDWDTPYVTTRALSFELSKSGKVVATTSLSRPVRELPFDALPVLQRFAAGATTPRAALADLRRDWQIEDAEFETVLERLRGWRLIIPHAGGDNGGEPDEPAAGAPADGAPAFAASSSLFVHHAMLADTVRVLAYQTAIARRCRGKTVLEIGCGSGILSIFAARAGAKRVIAVEEMEVAELAEEMIRANGCGDTVELHRGNSRDLDLDEPVDIVLHEIFGVDPFEENLVPALADAQRRWLRPGGELLPHRLEVFCLGLELAVPPHRDKPRAIAETRQLERLYGVDFGPYLRHLEAADPALFPRPWDAGHDDPIFRHRVLSEELRLLDLDLHALRDDATVRFPDASLRIRERGVLDGYLIWFRAHLDDGVALSTSPYAPLTNWGRKSVPLTRPLQVAPGDRVPLEVDLVNPRGKQRLSVALAADGDGDGDG